MGNAERKARKSAARAAREHGDTPIVELLTFHHPERRGDNWALAPDVVNVLFTKDGQTRPAPEVERELAKIGTSIAEVHQRLGARPQSKPRAGLRRTFWGKKR